MSEHDVVASAPPAETDAPGTPPAAALRVVTDVFEGPIDLLLTLAQRRQFDLNKLRLADLTGDYLAAISVARPEGEERSAEEMAVFLVVGSRLLALKAAALLPSATSDDEEELTAWEDRVRVRLQDYQRFKEVALDMMRRHTEGSFAFTSAIEAEIVPSERLAIEPDGLAAAFQAVLDRLPPPEEVQVELRQYSLAAEVNGIRARLLATPQLSFTELFDAAESRLHAVVIFLALLELVRRGEARFKQRAIFGEIEVMRGPEFGTGGGPPVPVEEQD